MGGVDDREQLVNSDGNQMDESIEFVNNSVSTLRLHLFLSLLHSGSTILLSYYIIEIIFTRHLLLNKCGF